MDCVQCGEAMSQEQWDRAVRGGHDVRFCSLECEAEAEQDAAGEQTVVWEGKGGA